MSPYHTLNYIDLIWPFEAKKIKIHSEFEKNELHSFNPQFESNEIFQNGKLELISKNFPCHGKTKIILNLNFVNA